MTEDLSFRKEEEERLNRICAEDMYTTSARLMDEAEEATKEALRSTRKASIFLFSTSKLQV